jgi:phosphatidylglycerophosphatase A
LKLNFFEMLIGSGFYTGYIPFASGTWGSLAALIIYLIPGFEKPVVIIPAIIVFIILGIITGNKFDVIYGKDPAECTVDEIVGMWISLLFLPKTFLVVTAAFFLWRAFDIIKPSPARQAEKLPGGLGIMMDDIIAGLYSLLLLHLILYIFK